MPQLPEIEPRGERQVFRFEDMAPSGVLWLINRVVFHPRGLSLAFEYAEDDPEARGWCLVASPDGSPYEFQTDGAEGSIDEAAKLRAVQDLIDLARFNGVMPPPLHTLPGQTGQTPTGDD